MNEQQNSSTFGIPAQSSVPLSSASESSIPGANLIPIGPEEVVSPMQTVSEPQPINPIPIINNVSAMPIPGIVTENTTVNANNLPLAGNANMVSSSNLIIPGIVNSSNQNITDITSTNFAQKSNSSLEASGISMPISNSILPQQMNNNSTPILSNDFGDATPLTNERFDSDFNGGDNTISVGKYLLFSIPVIGFVMLLVNSFTRKNKNIRNMAIAHFILLVIVVIILVVFWPKLNNIIS